MACQFFQWLIAGSGVSTLQYALSGIGCLLVFDVLSQWRNRSKQFWISEAGVATAEQIQSSTDREQKRRAA